MIPPRADHDDPFDLQRFVDAQAPVIERVRAELSGGRKASHWMWFVFPQIAGLGSSPMARRYAIATLDEAAAFLAHPVLGLGCASSPAWSTPSRGRARATSSARPTT